MNAQMSERTTMQLQIPEPELRAADFVLLSPIVKAVLFAEQKMLPS